MHTSPRTPTSSRPYPRALRLFVAFLIPPEVADACARLGQGLPERATKRVRPELMHLTLAFIGWVQDPVADAARAAVAEAAAGIHAFRARLGTAGAFPSERRPRVVWVGLGEGADAVRAAAGGVRAALSARAVPFDDAPPVAHVTIARVRGTATPDERRSVATAVVSLGHVPQLAFDVTDLHLMRSVLSPRGPTYTGVASAPLRG